MAVLGAGVLTLLGALGPAGCSVGGGESSTGGKPVEVAVTRDFGASVIGRRSFGRLPAGPTVMRLLQSEFDVETDYGGRFVTAIEDLASTTGPARDWFYYVNGAELGVGAAERRVRPGDRVQWDYHRWDGMTIGKQIVGAFPQPLWGRGARVVCARRGDPNCALVARRLRAAGVRIADDGAVPVAVGVAGDLARAPRVPDLTVPGAASGLFVRARGATLQLLDQTGVPRQDLPMGGGAVLAAGGEQDPVWIVTGSDPAGVTAAAGLLTRERLSGRFARWVDAAGRPQDLPLRGGP